MMQLELTETNGRKEAILKISREFDYLGVPEARKALASLKNEHAEVIVDMADTHFIDSSGLGFLLMVHCDLPGESQSLRIINCQPHIKRVFERAQFQQIMNIQ